MSENIHKNGVGVEIESIGTLQVGKKAKKYQICISENSTFCKPADSIAFR